MAEVVRMPALSDTMEEGTLVAWHKAVGENVSAGELLAEIETDKAVMEFQSFFDGVLLHIGVEEGQSVPVDQVIAVIGKEGEDYAQLLTESAVEEQAPSVEVVEMVAAPLEEVKTVASSSSDNGRLKASPLAKAMAKEEGIDLNLVSGSGDDGRIVKRDIESFLKEQVIPQPVSAPSFTSPEGSYEDVPVSQMRKVIAKRLGESKFAAPHFYLTMEICMDKAMAARKQLNSMSDTKISFNDLVVKATTVALKKNPAINSSWLGDKIRYYNYVNMGIAVAMEEGLVVPVIANADSKSLGTIAAEIKELAGKAKDRKLTPEQMSGNTFTISNLGMFGIEEFTAIINPPDACILAVGRIASRLVRNGDDIADSNFMKVTLSCDHRVVDGAKGSKFLQDLRDILEEPMRMLL